MAEYLIQDTTLTGIADAIRNKTGKTEQIEVQNMSTEIENIEITIDYINNDAIEIASSSYSQLDIFNSVSFNNVKKINSSAFYECRKITEINFPKATEILDFAFSSCTNLTSINLPVAQKIGNSTFSFCYFDSILLPECTEIGSMSFNGCPNLIHFEAPKLKNIGRLAFQSCANLTNIVAPKLYRIEERAFVYAPLQLIELPGMYIGTEYIANEAFLGCNNLVAVVFPNAIGTPPVLGTDVFVGTPIENGTGFIYVPDESVDNFKTAENWNTWASQIKPLSEYTGAV